MKNLVLVTSVINTPKIPLSYTSTRSVFNNKERYSQTIKTIQSIREKIPSSNIFIIECSDLSQEYEQKLREISDFFLNLYENKDLRKDIYGPSKALGEGTMTISALKYIQKNQIKYDNLIKISGRYWIDHQFDSKIIDNTNIVVKPINENLNNICTVFYKIPESLTEELLQFFLLSINSMKRCEGFEVIFARFVIQKYKNVKFINILGISGYVSVCGGFYHG